MIQDIHRDLVISRNGETRNPNIDPNILQSLLRGPPKKGIPNFLKLPYKPGYHNRDQVVTREGAAADAVSLPSKWMLMLVWHCKTRECTGAVNCAAGSTYAANAPTTPWEVLSGLVPI